MTAQDKIWRVIRGLGQEFTVEDVMVLVHERYSTVSVYVSVLRKAGYLRKTGSRRSPNGGGQSLYRLIKNTGPKAPMQRRCLYDPNTDELREAEHVA